MWIQSPVMAVKEVGSPQRHAEARILIINAVYLTSLEVSSDFKLGF